MGVLFPYLVAAAAAVVPLFVWFRFARTRRPYWLRRLER